MEGDSRAVCALSPDAQRDLLRHCAGRQEDGGFFAKQTGYLMLELLDPLAGAIDIQRFVVTNLIRHCQQRLAQAHTPVAAQEAVALRENRFALLPLLP